MSIPHVTTPLEEFVLGAYQDDRAAVRAAYATFARELPESAVAGTEAVAATLFACLAKATRPADVSFTAELLRRRIETYLESASPADADSAWTLGVVSRLSTRMSEVSRAIVELDESDRSVLLCAARVGGKNLQGGRCSGSAASADELGVLAGALERRAPIDVATAATALMFTQADRSTVARIGVAVATGKFVDARLRSWAQRLSR